HSFKHALWGTSRKETYRSRRQQRAQLRYEFVPGDEHPQALTPRVQRSRRGSPTISTARCLPLPINGATKGDSAIPHLGGLIFLAALNILLLGSTFALWFLSQC